LNVMLVRNSLALLMVGMMIVPAGAAEEATSAEDSAQSQQKPNESLIFESPLVAALPEGNTVETNPDVVCMVLQLLSVSCHAPVDADYGSGSGPGTGCTGASGCEASIFAPYPGKHVEEGLEKGHVWFCVKTSGC
jgi:hypothetical protein